jgi:SUMO ligase MMS21 Smc5/6 complex component
MLFELVSFVFYPNAHVFSTKMHTEPGSTNLKPKVDYFSFVSADKSTQETFSLSLKKVDESQEELWHLFVRKTFSLSFLQEFGIQEQLDAIDDKMKRLNAIEEKLNVWTQSTRKRNSSKPTWTKAV